jgi:hypothetical protein
MVSNFYTPLSHIPSKWMSPSPPGHDSEQRNVWSRTSNFLHVCGLCLSTHTNGVTSVYLRTSRSVSSGLRRRMLRQTAVDILEECVARRFRAQMSEPGSGSGWLCRLVGRTSQGEPEWPVGIRSAESETGPVWASGNL